jgi:hypothetical protein
MSAVVREAESDADLEGCHPMMHQLRTHVPFDGWLEGLARSRGCRVLALESGVQRFSAHRFRLRQRMEIRAHHFMRFLDAREG